MDYFFIAISALLGLIIGSFLNCLVWRIYKEESMLGRSYCPNCSKQIAWYDNIPLLSFIILRGRCRHCQEQISWQYPLVEFFTGLLFALSFLAVANEPNMPLLLARDWLLIITFVIVFVYDFRWQLVPMLIVWPMIIVAAGISIFLGFPWQEVLLFGAVGTSFFLIQYFATAKRGIGEGDIWLGLLIGVALPEGGLLALALILSYFVGAIVSGILLLGHRRGWKSKIALGPFLSFGAIITLIYGREILAWYSGLF